ncbi:MAG TPA: prolyl aminopeptidase, partial [Oligoflexia bacterium]|nr:prolyl aminopeptidase [Oligoflexia bacterium]
NVFLLLTPALDYPDPAVISYTTSYGELVRKTSDVARKRKMTQTKTPPPPYEKGYFPVSDGHRLYYERYGNPKGIPVLFLHGGPGAGFHDSDKRFFNPRKFNVLFFDQRGAGRSKPFAATKGNTSFKLVSDIQNLLAHFSLKKVIIAGGSWGSTLALLYAISHPEQVRHLVLRGIFLADKEGIDYYLKGGIRDFYPEQWERFISLVPKSKQRNVVAYYLAKMRSSDRRTRSVFAAEWVRYEAEILRMKPNKKTIERLLNSPVSRSLAVLEAHYMHHRFFLENNYILRHANHIEHIPATIIHGRYDFVCPPSQAFRLKKKLPKAKLQIVCAGHSGSEPEIEQAFISEMSHLAAKFKRRKKSRKKGK